MNASDLFKAGRRVPTTKIVGPCSAGVKRAFGGNLSASGAAVNNYSALVANTWTTVIDETGKGELFALAVLNLSTVSLTLSVRLTVDGNVLYDKASTTSCVQYEGLSVVGLWALTTPPSVIGTLVPFDTSLKVEIKENYANNSLQVAHYYQM